MPVQVTLLWEWFESTLLLLPHHLIYHHHDNPVG